MSVVFAAKMQQHKTLSTQFNYQFSSSTENARKPTEIFGNYYQIKNEQCKNCRYVCLLFTCSHDDSRIFWRELDKSKYFEIG